MIEVYSVADVRAAEEATGHLLTDGTLMQRAASGLARVVADELRGVRGERAEGRGSLRGTSVLVVAGSGNNGGDALFAGARLATRGVRVLVWLTGDTAHEAGLAACRDAGGRIVDALGALAALDSVDLVLDGVLGIGGRGGLREPVLTFARACADTGVRVVAVDLPSGLEGDSGRPFDSFTAEVTVTFGARKPCQLLQPAASACGRVELVDIGLPLEDVEPALRVWEPADVAAHYPWPGATSDKYSRGCVGIDTGSATYPGAAVLSTLGAVYGGAGFVRYLGGARDAVVEALPNVVPAEGRVQAWLLGCGWGDRPDAPAVVAEKLATGLPVVLDADAIAAIERNADAAPLRPDVLLTPHAGELARLLGVERSEVEAEPVAHACRAASETGATVLLKGATQYVAEPSGRVTLAVPGPAWTAQAGSGDTLAGLCAAMLAAGLPAAEAALVGASLQALAADAWPGPRPPQDLVRHVPDVLAALRPGPRPRFGHPGGAG